ncbi:D-aminoacyl-tRNA deacylase [Pigmentibacter ruber]|uniref:D-aminoacyl-tRNA deacylase n=1 Tax=Pigmentibacter ruber TaxID=2683196 RepID=UPI00131DBF2A|nr:D-aminoacyl-tRNA deacylase [Pigmentibacter ruber]BFD32042.1 D-aminoacyl-tRNA deacylase [Pigmentibacter ruber]
MSENLILRAIVQRAKNAEVTIEKKSQGFMENGLLVLLGIGFKETAETIPEEAVISIVEKYYPAIEKLLDKIINLRIFEDEHGKMNLSILDTKGSLYIVSQFTLFGDCRKGNRPSFTLSAKPSIAEPMYQKFVDLAKKKLEAKKVLTGVFAANMQVSFCNDGPVTLIIESTLKGIM